MTLFIDSRERDTLPKQLQEKIEDSEIKALDAGDYWITKQSGMVIIERSTYTDFVGKIMSGRLWKQMDKCLQLSDDVYFILENPFKLKFTRMSLESVIGAMISMSRKVKIITTRSQTETRLAILNLHKRFNSERKVEYHETRVKPKTMTPKESAIYCLSGIAGVGGKTASKLLESYSIADLCKMEKCELEPLLKSKTDHFYGTLHGH